MKHESRFFEGFPRPSKKTLILITITAVATLIAGSIVSMWLNRATHLQVPNIGNIRTLGVEGYWDINLQNRTEEITWGTIWPGASVNVTFYLRSISNVETTLNLMITNWMFLSSDYRIVAGPNSTTPYMNLAWNYKNTIVHPGEILQVTLTLSVANSPDLIEFLIANDVRAFSVDITISTSDYS